MIHCNFRVMKNSVEKHLRPIINAVVDRYPYYNRSFGHDHFLVYPYDFGVLCSGRHLREDWTEIDDCPVDISVGHKYFCHVTRILNTSFIGNYGMDARHYKENEYSFGLNKCIGKCPKVVCHRPDIDIVTPQYLTSSSHDCFSDITRNNTLYVDRKFDSCFKGNYQYQRSILAEMKINDKFHYMSNRTERFRESDDLQQCVFAYHMCGQACWSQRLYDALALGAIPILVTDGAIQAFERYLDWRAFTVKISVPELFQDKFTFRFRRTLRKYADEFRRKAKHASLFSVRGISKDTAIAIITQPEASRHQKKRKSKGKSTNVVLKKMIAGQAAMKWFNFRDLKAEVNAFRMLVLEMFCRIVRQRMKGAPHPPWSSEYELWDAFGNYSSSSSLAADEKFQHYVCTRRPDFTARLRFMQ